MSDGSHIDIERYPGYRVGQDGSIWTSWAFNGRNPRKLGDSWRPMRTPKNHDGYPTVGLYRDGKAHRVRVHHLVLRAFVGECPEGMEACHNNGDAGDCRVENLRWDTHEANIADRVTHGTAPRGERAGQVVLTEAAVREIRTRLRGGEMQKDVAREFGVAASTVSGIARGRLWGWLDA